MAGAFRVRATLAATDNGLTDTDHEGNLRVGVWGSWGRHRIALEARLPLDDSPTVGLPLGPFILPLLEEYRGDEHLYFVVMASSHYSGDEGLDAEQHDRGVLRDIQIGMAAIPLTSILPLLGGETAVLRHPLRQQHTFETPASDPDYELATFKGTLVVQIESTSRVVVPYPAVGKQAQGTLLYGSERAAEAEQVMRTLLAQTYDHVLHGWKPADNDDGVDAFHITEWQSDVGYLPPVAYLQHEMEQSREVFPHNDWKTYASVYERSAYDAQIMDRGLRATWASSGVAVDESIAAIHNQLTQSASDASVSPAFLDALRNIADFAREHATCMHYTRDYYYRNPNSTKRNKSGLVQETGSENWSTTPVTGLANACDCDECGMTTHEALEKLALMGKWADRTATPLLFAVTRVMALFMPFTAQGLVTTGFVDTNGNRLEAGAKLTLPLKNTIAFAKQNSGGHFFGMWLGRAFIIAALRLANPTFATDLPELARVEPAAYEYHMPAMIVEGTGSTDVFILPAGEYAPLIMADAAQSQAVMDADQSRHDQFKLMREKAPTLFGQLKLYQPPHYVAKQDPMQTLTPFYRYITQLQCNALYQMNPLYGHLKPVTPSNKTFGVYVVDFLRAALTRSPKVGLLAIYGSLAREEWASKVAPVMACLQNQLPLSIVGRSTSVGERENLLRQQGHIIGTGSLMAFTQVPFADHGPSLDRLAYGTERHVKSVTSSSLLGQTVFSTGDIVPPLRRQGTTGTVRPAIGFLETWQLTSRETTSTIVKELTALKATGALEDVTWIRNRKLSQADDSISVRLLFKK